MTLSFNDRPIQNPENDEYGVTPFAASLAKSIVETKEPFGTTIALNGKWGSGKSSVVNLVRKKLEESYDNETIVVSEFKCWWFRGEEALALAFLQNLDSVLYNKLNKKIRAIVPRIASKTLQASQIVASAAIAASTGSLAVPFSATWQFTKQFFSDKDTLETSFNKLSQALKKEKRRFLIIIDDIDRLEPSEALAVFRLIKSVGQLPNVLYLLAFDRTIVEKAIEKHYSGEGKHFLEKIIQVSFEVPLPVQADLDEAVSMAIRDVCGDIKWEEYRYATFNILDLTRQYIKKPRDAIRFHNTIRITWPMISNEINPSDFVVLETFRLFESDLFRSIRNSKELLCIRTTMKAENSEDYENALEKLLSTASQGHHSSAEKAVGFLFPSKRVEHNHMEIQQWHKQRRICTGSYFDTYFRFMLSNESLPTKTSKLFIDNINNIDAVIERILESASINRENRSSMTYPYLNLLATHSRRIDDDNVTLLISRLFAIYDTLTAQSDYRQLSPEHNSITQLYRRVLEHLVTSRFSIETRTEFYLAAMESSSLGWTVYFASFLKSGYQSWESSQVIDKEEFIVTQNSVSLFTDIALRQIRAAAADVYSLIEHPCLSPILYAWWQLSSRSNESRSWTDLLIDSDRAVATLAEAFTEEDEKGFPRGSMKLDKTMEENLKGDIDVIDLRTFKEALERIKLEQNLERGFMNNVEGLIKAWDEKIMLRKMFTSEKQENDDSYLEDLE